MLAHAALANAVAGSALPASKYSGHGAGVHGAWGIAGFVLIAILIMVVYLWRKR